MKKHFVVDSDNLPMRAPTEMTLIMLLCMKVYGWKDWGTVVICILLGIAWLVWIVNIFRREERKIWE